MLTDFDSETIEQIKSASVCETCSIVNQWHVSCRLWRKALKPQQILAFLTLSQIFLAELRLLQCISNIFSFVIHAGAEDGLPANRLLAYLIRIMHLASAPTHQA